MDTDFVERRRHIRVYFDGYDEMHCHFKPEGQQDSPVLCASVLDISLGGIHLAIDGAHSFDVGDRLLLTRLDHQSGSFCDEPVDMEIRWVFTRQDFDRLYMGCQFSLLAEQSHAYISSLIGEKIQQKSTVVQTAPAECE